MNPFWGLLVMVCLGQLCSADHKSGYKVVHRRIPASRNNRQMTLQEFISALNLPIINDRTSDVNNLFPSLNGRRKSRQSIGSLANRMGAGRYYDTPYTSVNPYYTPPTQYPIVTPTPYYPRKKTQKHFYYSHHEPLSEYYIKETLLQLLYESHLISKNTTLTDLDLKMLRLILEIFEDIQLDSPSYNKCPYYFTKSGKLCLAAMYTGEKFTWEEAREYCQYRGGDLAIFKDANEFQDILSYLKTIDPEHEHSYWAGLEDLSFEGVFHLIDGSIAPRHVPFWGTDHGNVEPNGGTDQNYAIFSKKDNFLLHDVSDADGKKMKAVPLCQYIKARDGRLSHPRRPSGIGFHLDGAYAHLSNSHGIHNKVSKRKSENDFQGAKARQELIVEDKKTQVGRRSYGSRYRNH